MPARVYSTLKVPGYREQSGGATGRGRMGTMARGDGRARARGAGVPTGYIAAATYTYRGARLLPCVLLTVALCSPLFINTDYVVVFQYGTIMMV